MEEIKIKIGETEYILNNNSDKYKRARREAGDNASPEVILAIYDRLAGLIKDAQGNEIKNGSFWEAYKRRKEEQPKYIKILEDREKDLEESEVVIMGLIAKNIDHKRAFFGNTMSIAAIIVAGLFIFLASDNLDNYFVALAQIDGFLFTSFLISSSIYLTYILAMESTQLDKHLKFIQESKKDFIESIGKTIVDIDSYEKFRKQKYHEGKNIKRDIKGSSEFWFVAINILFIVSFLPLLIFLIHLFN